MTVPQSFPVFHDLDILAEYWSGVCKMPLYFDLFDA